MKWGARRRRRTRTSNKIVNRQGRSSGGEKRRRSRTCANNKTRSQIGKLIHFLFMFNVTLAGEEESKPPPVKTLSTVVEWDNQPELSKASFSHIVNEEKSEGQKKCNLLDSVSKVSEGDPVPDWTEDGYFTQRIPLHHIFWRIFLYQGIFRLFLTHLTTAIPTEVACTVTPAASEGDTLIV
jgi:hypothetical protein